MGVQESKIDVSEWSLEFFMVKIDSTNLKMYQYHLKESKKQKNNPAAYYYLGLFAYSVEKYGIAEKAYKSAIEWNPPTDRYYIGLGEVYLKRNKYGMAKKCFEEAKRMNPKSWLAYSGIGMYYIFKCKYPEAIKAIKKAIRLIGCGDNTDMAVLYANLGYAHWRIKAFTKSILYYKRSMKFNPEYELAQKDFKRVQRSIVKVEKDRLRGKKK